MKLVIIISQNQQCRNITLNLFLHKPIIFNKLSNIKVNHLQIKKRKFPSIF